MNSDWLDVLITLEQALVHYDESAPDGRADVAVMTGRRPVLVSAPHATRHWRNDSWKREDEYTAAIAHWLHEQTGVHAMYATYRLNPDPHADSDQGPYKRLLRELIQAHEIRFVLDLHGARGDRDFAIALGTIHGETCAPYEEAIVTVLGKQGFGLDGVAPSLDRLAVNPPRYAGGTYMPTVTRFVWQELGVLALQVEINSWARIVKRLPESYAAQHRIAPHFRGDPARIARVLAGLRLIIDLVDRTCSNDA
jgi:hypothetical protein